MAENAEPPPSGPLVDLKTGNVTDVWLRWLEGREYTTNTSIGSILSGQTALVTAQQQAEANAAAQAAANAAAAQAALGGSTTSDYDDFSAATVTSGTYSTYATCNITTTGAGNYTVSAEMVVTSITDIAAASGVGGVFLGDWRIVENPNTHVLASGTFTITSTFNSGEGGAGFYTNVLTFGTALPTAAVYADNETGATTVELQLRRASGSNNASELYGSLLTVWA